MGFHFSAAMFRLKWYFLGHSYFIIFQIFLKPSIQIKHHRTSITAKIHCVTWSVTATSPCFCPVFRALRGPDAVPQYTNRPLRCLRRGRVDARNRGFVLFVTLPWQYLSLLTFLNVWFRAWDILTYIGATNWNCFGAVMSEMITK